VAVKRLALLSILVALAAAGVAAAAAPPSLLHPATLKAKAPATYAVSFATTKGTFVITVHRAWAPRGADRFYNLVRAHFFDGVSFFRVDKGFVAQFGISGTPAVSKAWRTASIPDDPVKTSNAKGTITFADAGPNTRTTQVFINLAANNSLDTEGFAPFGVVTSGMNVVGKLYGGYGDRASADQQQITLQGNAFLKKHFPRLDHVETAKLVASH
jgi:peptidyl-prolyl cis-trans isomerase A (cyclophilin A)